MKQYLSDEEADEVIKKAIALIERQSTHGQKLMALGKLIYWIGSYEEYPNMEITKDE